MQACDYFADEDAIQACCNALGARLFMLHTVDGTPHVPDAESSSAQIQAGACKVCIDCLVLSTAHCCGNAVHSVPKSTPSSGRVRGSSWDQELLLSCDRKILCGAAHCCVYRIRVFEFDAS